MSKRVKFFIGHLSVSFIFILLLTSLIFFVWFIPPLDRVTGILPILGMLIIIDLFIGPLLGFFVYKEGKKTLKFDLSIVILLQFSLFLYGVHVITQARPVWIVYNLGAFDLVRSFEVSTQNIEDAEPKFQTKSLFYPKFVAVGAVTNSQRFSELQAGMSMVQKPEKYVNLHDLNYNIKTRNLDLLKQYNQDAEVERVLNDFPDADSFIPLKVESNAVTVLFNKGKGEVVRIVDLRPWK